MERKKPVRHSLPRRGEPDPGVKLGRPLRTPTIQQIHDAFEFAKTGADEKDIAMAVGIPEATYRHNHLKPQWQAFRAEISRGRGQGNVLVLGENYNAAISKTDSTRGKARELHLKVTGVVKNRVELETPQGRDIRVNFIRPK